MTWMMCAGNIETIRESAKLSQNLKIRADGLAVSRIGESSAFHLERAVDSDGSSSAWVFPSACALACRMRRAGAERGVFECQILCPALQQTIRTREPSTYRASPGSWPSKMCTSWWRNGVCTP